MNAKTEWALTEQMTLGLFTEDSEKDYVKKQYQKKLEQYTKAFHEAQNKADQSGMHYYKARIQEVQAKLKDLETSDADPAKQRRYKELLAKRDEAERRAHAAKTEAERKKWVDLMWKYNDELRWLGPEVTNPTRGPAPDGTGESWLPRRR